MIDFSKYTLQELQAITDALDTLTDDIVERDLSVGWVFREYRNARAAVEKKIAEQARDAAEPAGDPPDMFGWVGDPPDMFGWVGDALDDLCAAGEVIGNDR